MPIAAVTRTSCAPPRRCIAFWKKKRWTTQGRLLVPTDQAINKIGHALHDHLPAFGDFCREPRIRQLLDTLDVHDPVLWQTMYIFKQPRIGGVVRWHQDASYLLTRPSSVLGMWLALEDATRENGCLWMAPGGHKSPLREQYTVDWRTAPGRTAAAG